MQSSSDEITAEVIKDQCWSDEESHQLFSVINRWVQKIHPSDEEEKCWKYVMLALKKFRAWEEVQFLCRAILLRCSMVDIRTLLIGVLNLMVGQHQEKVEIKCGHLLSDFLIEASEQINSESFLVLINSLTLIFPIFPGTCSDIFVSGEFQDQLKKNFSFRQQSLIRDGLSLLSAACIDDSVRTFIAENYVGTLEEALEIENYKISAALVLTKIWSFTKLKDHTLEKCVSLFVESVKEKKNIEPSVEALAYLTLKSSVRIIVRNDGDFCLNLVDLMRSKDTPVTQLYGMLVIFANVGAAKKENQDAMNKLKSTIAAGTPKANTPEETEEEIQAFNCDYVLDLDLLGTLKSKNLSESSFNEVIKIIHNVARDKKSALSCVKQGVGVMLLNYLVQKRELAKDDLYLMALRSLCVILIYVDPKAAFNKISPLSAIPFLMELLPNIDHQQDSDLAPNTLDSYQALMALTNLATINDGADLGKILTSNQEYWGTIEALLLDSTKEIQRSVLELLANLMTSPLSVAVKFFNFENPRSVQNFGILVKLLNLEDVRSQRAVAGIFANIASTVPFIAQELAQKKILIETALKVFISQSEDSSIRERLLVLFYSLSEFDVAPFIHNDKLFTVLQSCNQSSIPGELTYELTKELLKKLKH